jgi:hypothetical protein
MPVPALLNQVAGYMAKVEAVYGTAETLTAGSDGIYPYMGDGLPAAPTELEYLFDGNIGRDVSTLFPALSVAPNGRGRKMDFPVLFKGAGTAYSAIVLPPREVDLLLQASGFDRTYSTTHTYTPTAAGTTYKSLTVGHYAQGKAHIMAGALADWSFDFNDLGVPTHSFALQGIGAVPTTLSLPTITYQYPTIIPPVAAGAVVSIGSWVAPDVKGGSFKLGRNIGNARARITAAGGHLGFVPGSMRPEITLMVEQTALVGSPFHTTGGIAPDALREAATPITVSVRFGSSATNRYTVTLNNAQLVMAKPAADDAIAMYELTFRGSGSNAVAVLFD